MTEIHGSCDDRMAPVREAFEANFERRDEVGASVCVTVDGETVVDLWGGHADEARTRPWEQDTIVNVYSTTKTMSFLCVLLLADRGELDLHAPVADSWPEFAVNGKEAVEVRHLLSHSAGLSGWEQPLVPTDLADRRRVAALLAEQAPWWEPGTVSGYHAMTQGFLIGEVVERVDGRSLGTFFREEIAEPLGADFHIGLDPVHDERVGELVPPGVALGEGVVEPDSIAARSVGALRLSALEPRESWWRRAEIPAAGGIGNARSVARVHSMTAGGGTVDGITLLSEAGVDRIFEEQTHGTDLVLGVPMRYGMGFGLPAPEVPIGPNPRTCFWGGWGGSMVVVDVDAHVSFAYVMNRMEPSLTGDSRGAALLLSTWQALASA
ncbi:MAG: serine hydrolase domain-containing protein [Actinomycetota bacterium]